MVESNVIDLRNRQTAMRRLHDVFFKRARQAQSDAADLRNEGINERAARVQVMADVWDQAAREVRALMMESEK